MNPTPLESKFSEYITTLSLISKKLEYEAVTLPPKNEGSIKSHQEQQV